LVTAGQQSRRNGHTEQRHKPQSRFHISAPLQLW